MSTPVKIATVFFIALFFILVGNYIIRNMGGIGSSEPEQDVKQGTGILVPYELVPVSVSDNDSQSDFFLPKSFEITVAAESLGKARFMALSPDGRMFLPDMVDYRLSEMGRIIILDDFDENTKRFKKQDVYLSGLRGPNSIAFYTAEDGSEWIYIALTEHLIRYPYAAGDTEPSSGPEIIYTFPNVQSANAIGGVWHISRTVNFLDDTMYVSVGSGCNACEQAEDERRAMILTMSPEGESVEVFAQGIRNAVGMEFVNGELYATNNGVDHLGTDAPNDILYAVERGHNYGWPYCYESDGEVLDDTTYTWQRKDISCDTVPLSFAAFDAHTAPLGIEYFATENSLPLLSDSFLVALHGSFDLNIGNGYRIMQVMRDGSQRVFMDGFLNDGERVGRPVDILQWSERAFFVTDDYGGRVYYVYAPE